MPRMCRRTVWLLGALLFALLLTSCAGKTSPTVEPEPGDAADAGHLELTYATQYDVAYRADGTCLLTIAGTDRYLLVPEDHPGVAGEDGVTQITYPLHDTYLAASSAMDFFRELDALDSVRLTSTKAQDWSLPEVVAALKTGDMLYAGKYSMPDYELLLGEGATLAIESTMVSHAPEVAERLADLGIPVLVERSSYEESPLGRLEWIKLYGLLTGRLDEAEAFFNEQAKAVEQLSSSPGDQRPTVAFFSLAANGHAVVRKPGDYVSQMIDLAGGQYFLADAQVGDEAKNALSTMNMEMESFYQEARDADVIIYNSAIDDELQSIDDLVAKNPRLADFAAVRNDNVWCTGKDLFQQPTCLAQLITEMSAVFHGTAGDKSSLEHLYQVHWKDAR